MVILNIDTENKRISLGLKQAQEDPWLKIGEDYPVGTELDGYIVRFQEGGVVVDLGNDLEGLVPEAQLPIPEGKSVESCVRAAQAASLKVMEVDPIHHRIILAVTELGELPAIEESASLREIETSETVGDDYEAALAEAAATEGPLDTTAPGGTKEVAEVEVAGVEAGESGTTEPVDSQTQDEPEVKQEVDARPE